MYCATVPMGLVHKQARRFPGLASWAALTCPYRTETTQPLLFFEAAGRNCVADSMGELSEAEGYLLRQIRNGDAEGWRQLVSRYQGRLVAFARGKIRQSADAEDLVQDTFIGFLKSLPGFRGEASIETYLFTILRRKIINWMRGRPANLCLLQDTLMAGGSGDASDTDADVLTRLAAPDPTASWYARRDESHEQHRTALIRALRELIDGYKDSENFRDLQIIEMLFYCRLANKDVAGILSLDEKHVALIKHRAIKRIRESVSQTTGEFAPADTMIADIWQPQRLSCPKRSTIGAHMLGTLEPAWQDYVGFHLERLGCAFCRANLDDLRRQTSEDDSSSFRERIMESTVGFLSHP